MQNSGIKLELAALGHFGICSEYTKDPFREADLIIYFHRLNMKDEKNLKHNDSFREFVENAYNTDAKYLLTMLKRSNRMVEYEKVKDKFLSYYATDDLKLIISEM